MSEILMLLAGFGIGMGVEAILSKRPFDAVVKCAREAQDVAEEAIRQRDEARAALPKEPPHDQ